ncbi:SusC/RagA family TonB-linked outer membrane protein [Geofilum sp. OHC36d9]|uniref:SusC/RagA family TonB-linked outer membrane protein n=1 Tax=Geofilum sp. OHC36d9 TaxID=3458413 RepID=UPI0040340F5B
MTKNRNSLLNHSSFSRSKLLLIFFLAFQLSVFGQGKQISGTVSDDTGAPIPGVNVTEKGTTNGTITNVDGSFIITVNGDDASLVFSFIGFLNQTVEISDQSYLNITLHEDILQLEEVVAIGYGVQKKKLGTGSSVNIGGEDIQKLNTTSAIDALKGVSAGVTITQSNGQPGASAEVYIRGIGTTGNSAPLYIVDGVSTDNINHLAPSDIESVDVLKDAASAAIYGSRAANGVILVTTKQGKKSQKATVSYDFYHGWHSMVNAPKMLNAQQYIEIMDEANANDYIARGKEVVPISWESLVPNYDKIVSGEWQGTDWIDEMVDDEAYVENHSVNITGGSDKSVYSLGFGYHKEKGIIGKGTNNTYKRINVRLNSDHSLITHNKRDVFKVGQTLTYTNSSSPTVRTGNIYWNDFHNALIATPVLPMYAEDESDPAYPYHYATDWNSKESNPIASMIYNGANNENNSNRIVGSAYVSIEPIRNLVFRSSYGVNAWFGSSRSYMVPYDLSQTAISTIDNTTQQMNQGYTWTFTNTLSYKYSVGSHNISALAGTEATRNAQNLSMQTSNEGNIFGDFEHAYIDNSPTITTNTAISGSDSYGWAMMSYFGRLSYDFNETYLLTGVLRYDGSSKFSEDNRWGIFPSVSAGWVATNETFMKDVPVLNFLKLRASWGQNGNQDISDFQYLSTLSYESAYYFFGNDKTSYTVGAYPARVPNEDISWETSEQVDLGFDAHFFDSALQFNFDWYRKDTRDWLVSPPSLASWGSASAAINGGSVRNQGIELVTSWNQRRGDFSYNVNVSLAHNKNEVLDIANEEKIIHGPDYVLSQGAPELYRAEVGYPIGYFLGYKTDGILQNEEEVAEYVGPDGDPLMASAKPGDVRFVDVSGPEGEPDGEIDDYDKVMLGNPNPDYILGFQFNADYKGFYLQLTANGMFGHQIAKSYRSFGDIPQQNYDVSVYDRWHGEGTSNKWPLLSLKTHSNLLNVSDLFIEDADFLRLSNLTVGYDLKMLFNKLPLSEARLYVSAKNLYTITNYSGSDPEVGYAPSSWASGVDLGLYPSARTYLVGVSLKF